MINPTLVGVFDVDSVGRRVVRETVGEAADILYLTDVPAAEQAAVLRRADVIFAQNTAKDLTTDELSLIRTVRLLQFYTAGVDFPNLRFKPPP